MTTAEVRICKYGHPFSPENRYVVSGGGGYCKPCNAKATKDYKKRNPDKMVKHITRYRADNSEKVSAWGKLRYAVKNGTVIKPEACVRGERGCKGRIEAHHEDHSKPLDVLWLCKKHHAKIHFGGLE